MTTVLIIGAGITGSLCASSLYKSLPNVSVKVWDKARGVGGRMTTSRGPNSTINLQADVGAQYITTEKKVLETEKEVYGRLLSEGYLKPLENLVEGLKAFPDETLHYVAPKGTGSLVKLFLNDLPPESLSLNHHIVSLKIQDGKFHAATQNNVTVDADVLISTIPVPQFLKLEGASKFIPTDVAEKLDSVTYSTRFVLIWFYDSADGFNYPKWVSKYISDDDIFRYVSLDNKKRNQNGPPVIVFHTTVNYGEKNIGRSKEEVLNELNDRARTLFPNWPSPTSLKCHKWLYSQVQNYYPLTPGCLVLRSQPLLILAGDAFSSSNLNGCIASAHETVKNVLAATVKL